MDHNGSLKKIKWYVISATLTYRLISIHRYVPTGATGHGQSRGAGLRGSFRRRVEQQNSSAGNRRSVSTLLTEPGATCINASRYGRILIRMQKKDQASKTWERAKLALYLIVMAKQPVKTQDIQGALSVCTQEKSIKFEQRRSVKPLEELLGPMVEVHLNNLVTLVHPTARE